MHATRTGGPLHRAGSSRHIEPRRIAGATVARLLFGPTADAAPRKPARRERACSSEQRTTDTLRSAAHGCFSHFAAALCGLCAEGRERTGQAPGHEHSRSRRVPMREISPIHSEKECAAEAIFSCFAKHRLKPVPPSCQARTASEGRNSSRVYRALSGSN
jgi:hypothetical protein